VNRQGNPPANPFGSAIFESLRWKEPERPAPTEAQRAREEQRLTGLRAMGVAIDGLDFDLTEEMHKRGMRTAEEIEAERAQAEQVAARDKVYADRTADFNRELREQDDAKGDAEIAAGWDETLGRFKRSIAKSIKKALR